MDVIHPVRVKVACIRNTEEARLAVSFGAAAIGMAAECPGGGVDLTESEIAEIAGSVPATIGTFLLTTRREAADLAELARNTGANTIQLWDEAEPAAYAHLRSAVPGISIVQSLPVVAGEPLADLVLAVPDRQGLNGALFKLDQRVDKPDKAMSDVAMGSRLWGELAELTGLAQDQG